MSKKTCIVTGANAGIGYETALALAKQGCVTGILCRTAEKSSITAEKLKDASGNQAIYGFHADLSSQTQIRAAASQICEKFPVVDVLVNNAGVWLTERTFTEDNIETVFAVNHIAYFLLSHLLYPALQKSEDPRVVCVGSDSHFQTHMHYDDLSLGDKYHGLKSYAQSKLANCLFTYEFARQAPDPVAINCVQPGLVHTDIGLKHSSWLHALAWKVRRTFWKSKTPAEGAATSIFLATSDEAKGETGKYWDLCKPKKSSDDTYDEASAKKLWGISMEMIGVDDYFWEGS